MSSCVFDNVMDEELEAAKKYFSVNSENGLSRFENVIVVVLLCNFKCIETSVTRLGDLLDFGQLFKACGNN